MSQGLLWCDDHGASSDIMEFSQILSARGKLTEPNQKQRRGKLLFFQPLRKKVEDLARLSLQSILIEILGIKARGIPPHLEGKYVLGAARTRCSTSTTVLCLLCHAIGVAMAREFFDVTGITLDLFYWGLVMLGSKLLLQDIISIFDGSVTTKAKEQDDLLLLWLQRCIWEWFER
ncbi:hypothetical protein Tco_1190408 [Tanacetum coccineum]